jgi:hypothetical protein
MIKPLTQYNSQLGNLLWEKVWVQSIGNVDGDVWNKTASILHDYFISDLCDELRYDLKGDYE